MEEKYFVIKEKLQKYNQEQLLNNYNNLNSKEKEELLDEILTINFNQIQDLYNNIKINKIEKNEKKEEIKIEPISFIEKEKISEQDKKIYKELGEQIIREGKYAIVTMAGGQGTRLGHEGPKGTFDIGLDTHQSIFELLCNSLKVAKNEYNVYIPWYIMTSKENNLDTIDFFEKNNYFNYPREYIKFFIQGQLPMVDKQGKILLDETGKIKQAADGHGGIFESMRKSAIIYDMKARNIQWVYIGGVDNVLAKMVDPLFVGLSINNKVLAAGKSVVKSCPEEKVGVFCRKNGRPSVVEYSEISKEMSEEKDANGELKFGESHILCNLFNIKAIEEISKNKLPYHSAYKKANYMDANGKIINVEKPNSYKFESFLFDAFESLEDMVILRVKREEEFAPVKNKDGVDSPQTARELYKKYYDVK